MNGFSLRKKAVGAYFNDSEVICSVQVQKQYEDKPDANLLASIKGSRDVFFVLYGSYHVPPQLLARVRKIVSDIEIDSKRRQKEARKRLAESERPRAPQGKE